MEPLGDQGLDRRRQRGEKRSYDRGGGHGIDERGGARTHKQYEGGRSEGGATNTGAPTFRSIRSTRTAIYTRARHASTTVPAAKLPSKLAKYTDYSFRRSSWRLRFESPVIPPSKLPVRRLRHRSRQKRIRSESSAVPVRAHSNRSSVRRRGRRLQDGLVSFARELGRRSGAPADGTLRFGPGGLGRRAFGRG